MLRPSNIAPKHLEVAQWSRALGAQDIALGILRPWDWGASVFGHGVEDFVMLQAQRG